MPTTLVAAALALVGISFVLFCACHRERRCPLYRPEESPVVHSAAVVHSSLAEPSGPSLVMGQVVGIGEIPEALHSEGASANSLLLLPTATAIGGALPHVGRAGGRAESWHRV